MEEAKKELVQIWLTKAQHDLAAARKLSADPDPYLDTAIYHCQQAAEKAVKGFLVFHDQRFDKTHDIEALISLAIPFDARFSEWLGVGQRLTPYAAMFRYPGEKLEPDRPEFEQALKESEDLYNFVLSLLPAEVHPQ
ncbi:MAG: HEPN domain-containing protein [Deltaproteobacteria bacterium]|nr:HEPN domain-containing protein [Deltaproteobacteria bacterium]